MRTRSSRSYGLGPRDIYEAAGYGLLDTIEETFYQDDAEEVDSSGLISLIDSDPVAIPVQPPRQLIVKLRIPSLYATSILPERSELSRETLSQEILPSDEPVLEVERPRLLVVLRMPRPAGQVKALATGEAVVGDGQAVIGNGQEQISEDRAEVLAYAVAEESLTELVDELLEDKAESCLEIGQNDQITPILPLNDIGAGIEQDAVSEEVREQEEQVTSDIENADQVVHPVGSPLEEDKEQVEESFDVAERQELEDEAGQGSISIPTTEDQPTDHDELLTEEEIQTPLDTVLEEQQVEDLAKLARGEDRSELHNEPPLVKEIHNCMEDIRMKMHQEEMNIEMQSHVDAASSESEEHIPVRHKLLRETELEAHSETPLEENSIPPTPQDEFSSAENSRSSHTDDEDHSWPALELLERPIAIASPMPTSLTMHLPELPSLQKATPPREPSQSKKCSPPSEDTAPRSKKRSLPLDGMPPQSQKRNRPCEDLPTPNLKKRSMPVDETPDAETHIRKKRRRRDKAEKSAISMEKLREATRGTGIIAAGRMAQLRRGILPPADHVATGRVHKPHRPPPSRPVKRPPQISGRQRLLDARILSSSQRLKGGGKARAIARPASRKQKG